MGNYLIHYGVLGMKWGVRKSRNESISKTKISKKRTSDSVVSKAKKSIGTPSQKETDVVKNLYKKYMNLSDEISSTYSRTYDKYDTEISAIYEEASKAGKAQNYDKMDILHNKANAVERKARDEAEEQTRALNDEYQKAMTEYNSQMNKLVKKYENVSINSFDRNELDKANKFVEKILAEEIKNSSKSRR